MGGGQSPPGLNHVPEYMVSGAPWTTGSLVVSGTDVVRIGFPNISKFFVVRNGGAAPVRVGFTESGITGSNFFSVNSGSVQQFDIRVRDVYFYADAQITTVDVLGGLTAIPRRNMRPLTNVNPAPTGSQYIPGI